MNDLLEFVLDVHGGRKRWSDVKTLTTELPSAALSGSSGDSLTRSWRRRWKSNPPPPTRGLPPLDRSRSQPDVRRRSRTGHPADRRQPHHRHPTQPPAPTLVTTSIRPGTPCSSATSSAMRCGTTSPLPTSSPTQASSPEKSDPGLSGARPGADCTSPSPTPSPPTPPSRCSTSARTGCCAASTTRSTSTPTPWSLITLRSRRPSVALVFPTRRLVYLRNHHGTPDRSLTAITIDIHDIAIT